MRVRALVVPLLAVLAIGCPGQKPPVPPSTQAKVEAPKGPLVWKLSKSGLGFRLSNADDEADNPTPRKVAPSTPLADADAKRIIETAVANFGKVNILINNASVGYSYPGSMDPLADTPSHTALIDGNWSVWVR